MQRAKVVNFTYGSHESLLDLYRRKESYDQVSEEGRHRSTVFPPLSREPRGDRKGWGSGAPSGSESWSSYQGPMSDISESHWSVTPKRIREGTDRRIVVHLRKKLNRRLEKRYDAVLDGPYSDGEDEATANPNQLTNGHNPTPIYDKYTDTGEKRRKGESSPEFPVLTNGFPTLPVIKQYDDLEANLEVSQGQGQTLEKVEEDVGQGEIEVESRVEKKGNEETEGNKNAKENGLGLKSNQIETTTVTKENNDEKEENDEDFDGDDEGEQSDEEIQFAENSEKVENSVENTIENSTSPQPLVSPVPTPVVFRPTTAFVGGLSAEEKEEALLSGRLDVSLDQRDNILRLYIHSAGIDTEHERSFLAQHAFPQLKQIYANHGLDLRVLDLQWGTRNLVADDHSDLDLRLNLMDACKENEMGYNFLTFLSQRYGTTDSIPPKISTSEFKTIFKAAQTDFNKMEAEKKRIESTVSQSEGTEEKDEAAAKVEELQKVQALKALSRRYEFADPEMLGSYYVLDMNAKPPVYRLQKISSKFPDVLSKDAHRRHFAIEQWKVKTQSIHNVLMHYARLHLAADAELMRNLTTSENEHELNHGLLQRTSPYPQGFWFKRDLENINLGDGKAREYTDMQTGSQALDPKRHGDLVRIKDEDMARVLEEYNTRRYIVNWSKQGVDPATTRLHLIYMEQLAKDVIEVVSRGLHTALKETVRTQPPPLVKEIEQHVQYCRRSGQGVQGRKQQMTAIKHYIRGHLTAGPGKGSAQEAGGQKAPLILYGKSGQGTTSLLARAACDTTKWLAGLTEVSCVVRMIGGASMRSTNICMLLTDLCHQLLHITDTQTTQMPQDYKGLFNYLSYLLLHVPSHTTLVLYLDSLHHLSDENEPKKLQWLPKEIPSNVFVVLGTQTEDESFKSLNKAYMASHPHNFIEVGDLPEEDAMVILEHWYKNSERCVTASQMEAIMTAFLKHPYPLYLKVLFHESLQWPSYQEPPTRLGQSVKAAALMVFVRLERDLGEALVQRALGYLTASRCGLSDNEMEDLLSLDNSVMDEISAHFSSNPLSVRRIPPIHWTRLRTLLSPYLTETRVERSSLVLWRYSQFRDAAEERYLKARDRPVVHRLLGEYFLNVWYQKPKPYGANEAHEADRCVMPQYLMVGEDTAAVTDTAVTSTTSMSTVVGTEASEENKTVYNLRRLNELPYHLLKSQQIDILKSECLMNYDFLLAKLLAMSLRSVYDDIEMSLVAEPGDLDLKMLSDTLHLSEGALIMDPRQLASQLVGRLQGILQKDKPIAPKDPRKYEYLHGLVQAAKKPPTPQLIPSITCLTAPGGILFDQLSGHCDPITAVTVSTDAQKAVTTSKDNTMKLWELRSGRVIKTILGVGIDVHYIRLGPRNIIVVTSETTCIRIWNMEDGECLRRIESVDLASITVANESQYLCAFFHGNNKMSVWDLKDDAIPQIKDVALESSPKDVIHKDHSIICSNNSVGPLVMHAFKSGTWATVRNCRTGNEVHRLEPPGAGSIQAVVCSRDYFLCAARYQYMKLHEIYQLELFDIRNGRFLRSVRGCVADNLSEIFVNNIGSHALAVCTSEAGNSSNIAVWNIETEDHKHLAKRAGKTPFGACADLRTFLTADRDENILRIWNISSRVNQTMPKEKVPEGLEVIAPMQNNEHYVIAKSVNHGPLAVWNLVKGKFSGKAVRVERGLTDVSDTLIIHNEKLVILAERGVLSVHAGSPPIYSTVRVYDLLKKKYVHQKKGCFIVPCPAHEYVMLDDDHLMGLADNRTHFVVWNIRSGHIVYRIKTNFKEPERKKVDRMESRKQSSVRKSRGTTAKMTPWERRSETESARNRRRDQEHKEEEKRIEAFKKEKENGIDKYLISKDLTTIVASYYAHHICVFDVPSHAHVQTLESPTSMLLLHVAALTPDGRNLVHANYDDATKTSYLTLWDTRAGCFRRRLRNERNVAAIAVDATGSRVVFGKTNRELRIWEPGRGSQNVLRRIKGYASLEFGVNSQIHMIENGAKAIVYAGDISLWDLNRGTVLSVFTPDMKIQCLTVCMEGKLIVFGLRDTSDVVSLQLRVRDGVEIEKPDKYLFGESSSEEEEEEDEEEEEI